LSTLVSLIAINRTTSIPSLLLIAFGIEIGVFVIDGENMLSQNESPRVYSGILNGMAVPTGGNFVDASCLSVPGLS